ncbi:MAG: hypothetical protein GF418_08165 [Chitinivibrionales bacterium]|nr:hypothetical protein [Chitinivibrionales bacterium]MBD3395588.1 hypothetical protein [Chitinivibrionales bacterium]
MRIRFYEELNDFLSKDRRKVEFDVPLFGSPGIKDVIESLGVPHTEVDLILVNGEIRPARKRGVLERIPAKTRESYDEFHECPDCGRVYWKGSHFMKMQAVIDGLLPDDPA